MILPKKLILQLALLTITAMPMVAIIIDRFSERVNLREALIGYEAWWKQIAVGCFVGIVIAILAKLLVESPLLDKVNAQYTHMLGRFKLSMNEIVFISLCAGVGEEILFRGALQPIFGVIITAIIFVAIHGYLNPRNWRLSIYGAFMVGAIAVIGWMSDRLGLLSAILAHTIIDIYLLHHLQKSDDTVEVTENPNLQDPYQEL
jgi:membrane protease YdiL (CAAX protease family)